MGWKREMNEDKFEWCGYFWFKQGCKFTVKEKKHIIIFSTVPILNCFSPSLLEKKKKKNPQVSKMAPQVPKMAPRVPKMAPRVPKMTP